METQNLLAPEPYKYGEIQRGSQTAKTNGHLQQTKLSQSKIENSYVKSHHAALQKYMTEIGVNSDNKRLINKLYKKLIDNDNIMKVYSHPIGIFFNALIEGDIIMLYGKSSASFKPSIRKAQS
jgi:hypothetical protein